jgi:ketosteroid isomerase-like protein
MRQMLTAGLTLVIGVFLAACSDTQADKKEATPEPAAAVVESPEDVEATIVKLEREWTSAIVKKDTEALGRLLADDFNGTSPTAHTYSKETAIEDLQKGSYDVASMELDEVSVNVYGNAAVAFASQEEKSKYDGKDISGHYHYTDVWVKRDGKWQAVASHGSRYSSATATEKKSQTK